VYIAKKIRKRKLIENQNRREKNTMNDYSTRRRTSSAGLDLGSNALEVEKPVPMLL
jgi:hypothetical protein